MFYHPSNLPPVLIFLRSIPKKKETKKYLAVFVETALLIEAGYQKFCDEVWYVWASKEERSNTDLT